MIRAEISATTLAEFYDQIVAQQEATHGLGYTGHHDVIRRCAHRCSSYAELGVQQGASLACAVLAGYSPVIGVDHRTDLWREHADLFGNQATVYEQDSLVPVDEVGFMLIDSRHTPGHLQSELDVHAERVGRYILIHDTTRHPHLFAVASRTPGWHVALREERNVGYTLLERC